ncbi:MAG: phenylalanine--tRNA ligase subunit beta [Halofilum sp. (in: g-proteobacteria)]|nr:phenylalanine--tRNA ligase subunit beta [Halofilum sp. (in: g-proteobacteria)]
MRVPEKWLREWVDPRVDTEGLCERLTLLGLEVDGVEGAAPTFSDVVIGEIVAVEAHPQADRLQVCRVSDGSEEFRVVCAAPNALAGLRVPFARVGASLPGGRIRQATLRGVESDGMLCSARDLGIARQHEGLLELPADAPLGEDLRRYGGFDESVIELELTPNRGDCLSIRGIAREVAAAWRLQPNVPAIEPVPATRDDAFAVWLAQPEACPRYVGRVLRDVDTSAATPIWMAERLQRAGIRPLSAVVDVTNYVMLELGQPMHAFDLRRLKEGLFVRWSRPGERLALLDGRSVDLDDDTLVIADASGPIALAGIMGGESTAVDEGTRDVFLESACFMPAVMAGRARRYACHTDSSHRFERGVDPALQAVAVERATGLILQICGGQPGPTHDSSESDALPQRPAIGLRRNRLERLLGYRPPDGEIEEILRRLGLTVTPVESGWTAVPPSWRYDLSIEADLIEEVARVWGYNRVQRTHGARVPRVAGETESHRSVEALRDLLVARDYREVITYSFVDPALQQRIDPDTEPLPLTNPIASDMSVMRTGLWPGLLQTLRHNLTRQQERVRIFELGRGFQPHRSSGLEQDVVAGLVAGPVLPEQWGNPERAADFFDLKGDVEALVGRDARQRLEFVAAQHPALHPGQSARVNLDGQPAGWVGVLHPRLQAELELGIAPVLFELALRPLLEVELPAYRPVSRYPSIRRDLALVVDADLPAGELLRSVRQAAGEDLQDAFIFDVYRGKGVDSGRKSVALGLILQGLSRTLTESEVEGVTRVVLDLLEQRHGATLRE